LNIKYKIGEVQKTPLYNFEIYSRRPRSFRPH